MPKVQNGCLDVALYWKKKWFGRECESVYSMSFFPLFLICTSHGSVCWNSLLSTLSCVILIATYQLPNLEVEPVFSWKKNIIANLSHSFLPNFLQDDDIWGRYSNLACINVCMLEGWESVFTKYIASSSWHPSLVFIISWSPFFLWKSVF